ncbi:M48 family metallopeptidase [Luteococcus sp. H138]|uniref:M48 metallopeptidase family protein n=1 Tax=unclassified Luteococcus TaxID=2639923 RepID=UPI00313D0473
MPSATVDAVADNRIQIDGVSVELRRSARRRKTVSARREGDVIVVLLPLGLPRREEQRWAETLTRRILGREAARQTSTTEDALSRRALRLAREHLDPVVGRPVRAGQIRWVTNQNQRWGSCSTDTGVIRLSSRLQTMPDWVVDYVLLHELTHLVEHNHTERFHALLAHYPFAERARGFLEGWASARADGDVDQGAGPQLAGEVD